MLFKKFLKRQEPVPVKGGKGSAVPDTPENNPADNPTDNTIPERRHFPRPMPLPDVVEHDWAVWVDVTKQKPSDKPD
jgi:hypothetical protein